MTVAVYVGGTAVTANQYDDGYLVVYRAGSGTAGYYYPIASHSTTATGSETITVTLKEPLVKATYTNDYFSLFANPWSGIGNVTDIAVSWSGQAMAAATSGQYLWVQTGGFGVAFGGDTSAVGTVVCPSETPTPSKRRKGIPDRLWAMCIARPSLPGTLPRCC